MAVRLLGPVEVDGGEWLRPRDRLVLAVLAARLGRVVSTDAIAEGVWGTHPPVSWHKQIQICVARLRKVLGPSAIATIDGGYRLVPEELDLDTTRFEGLLDRARDQIGLGDPDRAATTLVRALSLVRGDPFEQLDWPPARTEAARLGELVRAAEDDLLEARLASGDHRDVASAAEALVAQDPLRERRWAALAVAQYRCGRQGDALRTLRTAGELLREQLGVDPGPALVELERRILHQDPGLIVRAPARPVSQACPYKGLAPLESGDPIFGRERALADCLARIATRRLLVVAGPSGSGKSSLVRAGLLPELARRGKVCHLVVPQPDGSLTLPQEGDVAPLLLVDQVEEIFSTATTADMRETCGALADYAQRRAPVILAVRGDHLADLAADPGLGRLVQENLHLLSAPTGADLLEAIERPAADAGYRLEPGLVDLVVRDVEGEPGALPLMSHALAETWHRRDGHVLTVEGYRAAGGIGGAVARTADRLYESLPADERAALRSVLLRLVVPALDGQPVRCRVPRHAFRGDSTRERVTNQLIRARLLTAQDEVVELSHEALVRGWPRLQLWLDEDASAQRLLRHLTTTAEGWETLGRPTSELYRGVRLEAAEQYRHSHATDLTSLEAEFLDASSAAAASERAALRHRADLEARQNRRLRQLLAVALSLLLVATAAGAVAVHRAGEARRAATEATIEALASRSMALRGTDRDVAALLAVEAVRRYPGDPRALSALLGTFTASPGVVSNHRVPGATSLTGALLPGGTRALVVLDGTRPAILDLETGAVVHRLDSAGIGAAHEVEVAVSSRGRRAAALAQLPSHRCAATATTRPSGCAALLVWDLRSGDMMSGSELLTDGASEITIDARGALVAVGGADRGEVTVHRATDGSVLSRVDGSARSLAFSGDGSLFLGSATGEIRQVAPVAGRTVATWSVPRGHAEQHLAPGDDGVLVAGGRRGLVAVNSQTGARLWTADLRGGSPDPCPWFTTAAATERLYCGSHYGEVEERDRATGRPTGTVLDVQLGDVGDLTANATGSELVVFGAQEPVITRWRLDGTGPVSTRVAEGYVAADRFGYADPATLLVARRTSDAIGSDDFSDYALWDTETGQRLDDIAPDLELGLQGMGWVGSNLLMGMDLRTLRMRWYDTRSRSIVGGADIGPECDHVFPAAAAGEPAFCSSPSGAAWMIDPATREVVGPTIRIDRGWVSSVSATRGGAEVVVTTWTASGPETSVHDGRTGRVLAGPVTGPERTFVGLGGELFGTEGGSISRYNLHTLERTGGLPGARGEINSLQLTDDGRTLLATSNDQSAALYDVASGTRLGDPISTSAPHIYPAFLRPDGAALALTDAQGVVVWDLQTERLVAAACQIAGRNLDRTEWTTYLDGPYRRTCQNETVGGASWPAGAS